MYYPLIRQRIEGNTTLTGFLRCAEADVVEVDIVGPVEVNPDFQQFGRHLDLAIKLFNQVNTTVGPTATNDNIETV